MKRSRLTAFCSLLLVLTGFSHTKPLREWTSKAADTDKERDIASDLNSIIETIKQDFLWHLNLSSVPALPESWSDPPQFMIDLYNRYAADKSSIPFSNIVRSFHAEDIQLSASREDYIQGQILLFNISIPSHEDVTQAELKMYVSLGESHTGHLLIYDILHMQPSQNLREPEALLESKQIEGSMWVTADVTRAAKRWLKAEKEKNKLEIFLKTNSSLEPGITANSNYTPLLIIFSDNKHNRMKESNMELREMIAHEQESAMEKILKANKTHEKKKGNDKHELDSTWPEIKIRSKRSPKKTYCQKSSLVVNFKDIGWDSWIIAPKSYEIYECRGECYYPLTDNLTPTKHAILQMLLHHKNPKKTKKACCVPTKLDSMPVLYKDDANVVTIKKQYEGMRVAQCGCR